MKFVHLLPSQNNPNLWRLVGTGPEQLVALAWPVRVYKPIEPKSSAQLLFQPTSTQWLSFNHKDYSTTLCSSQLAVTRVYKCILIQYTKRSKSHCKGWSLLAYLPQPCLESHGEGVDKWVSIVVLDRAVATNLDHSVVMNHRNCDLKSWRQISKHLVDCQQNTKNTKLIRCLKAWKEPTKLPFQHGFKTTNLSKFHLWPHTQDASGAWWCHACRVLPCLSCHANIVWLISDHHVMKYLSVSISITGFCCKKNLLSLIIGLKKKKNVRQSLLD